MESEREEEIVNEVDIKPEDRHMADSPLDPADPIVQTGKQLMESEEVAEVAKKVLEKENIEITPAEVGYFMVYPNLSKTMVAKCLKATREVKYYSGNDYLIEISADVWDMLDERTKYMLVYHELLHIYPDYNEKKQEWIMKLRPHDFGDFFEINDRHGSDWYKLVQSTVSSLHDMNPNDEGKISF